MLFYAFLRSDSKETLINRSYPISQRIQHKVVLVVLILFAVGFCSLKLLAVKLWVKIPFHADRR